MREVGGATREMADRVRGGRIRSTTQNMVAPIDREIFRPHNIHTRDLAFGNARRGVRNVG